MPKRNPARGLKARSRPSKGSLTTPATASSAQQQPNHDHPSASGKNPVGLAKLKARILGDGLGEGDSVNSPETLLGTEASPQDTFVGIEEDSQGSSTVLGSRKDSQDTQSTLLGFRQASQDTIPGDRQGSQDTTLRIRKGSEDTLLGIEASFQEREQTPRIQGVQSLTEVLVESEDEMSSRNRPRNGALKDDSDAHEETTMWNQIKKDVEKLGQLQKRQREVIARILEMEDQMARQVHVGVKETDDLQALYREQVKLSSEEGRMLNEEPTDLIRNIEILQALRTASSESNAQRNGLPSKVRKPKAPKSETDGAADSPGPSPGLSISAARLKGTFARSGSVASARDGKESSIKIEEGLDGGKGSSAERAGKFVVGAEVAYKQPKTTKDDTGDWIQCIITKVIDLGNKRRYEVQDTEPDDPNSITVYTAPAAALIAIPPAGAALPDFAAGKLVLARYPETTTFYRAEVTGVKKDSYRLKFEDDQNQEMEVDRRYVLDVGSK